MAEFMKAVSELTFGVWFLIGAALVFFMQYGFAMVEADFTRAKNAGNIIMKNLMDFCIGSVVFVTLGSGLMLAEDYVAGVIGLPNLGIFMHWDTYNRSGFVFNLVFCATAATEFGARLLSVCSLQTADCFTAAVFANSACRRSV